MLENEISAIILDAAIEVHRVLGGPGLLESIYEEALARELTMRGLRVERQVAVPVTYKGIRLSCSYRLDMLVERKVIVESKATHKRDPSAEPQTLTYLRNSHLRLGLVINFGEPLIKNGIRRVVNRLVEHRSNGVDGSSG